MFLSKGINVLSLFDGKSSGRTACDLAGIGVNKYYSSEIDKYANVVSNALYPDIVRLGDITNWREWLIDWASIDLILAGSPCQGFSFAGKQGGTKAKLLNGEVVVVSTRDEYLKCKNEGAEFLSHSHLFWEFVLIQDHINSERASAGKPSVESHLENVKMSKNNLDMITDTLGFQSVFIDSMLVSAQNRKRYYWTNWDIPQPEDREIFLKDIVEYDVDPKYFLSSKLLAGFDRKKERRAHLNSGFDSLNIRDHNAKASTLTARYSKTSMSDPYIIQRPRGFNKGGIKGVNGKSPTLSSCSWEHNNYIHLAGIVRKFTPRECFRLQTVQEHLIDKILACGVSNTQLYKIAGNGWTDEVIAHNLRHSRLANANT